MKYSPGPWRLSHGTVRSNDLWIASINAHTFIHENRKVVSVRLPKKSNAELIRAAPELLDELRFWVSFAEKMKDLSVEAGDHVITSRFLIAKVDLAEGSDG